MNDNDRRVRIGIIDCGSRGSDYVRVFNDQAQCEVAACADLDRTRLERLSRSFPDMQVTADYQKLLADKAINAVIIAAPVTARAQITREALKARKHVFVEAPLCTSSREVRELTTMAEAAGLVLMAGHTLLFDDTTATLREMIAGGELGPIKYVDAVRTGIGPMRTDVNVLYDLATHTINLCNHLLGTTPIEVSALGSCLTQADSEDVCFVTLKYSGGTLVHIHTSRLNPRASNTLTIVGQQRTVHWDATEPTHSIRFCDTTPRAKSGSDTRGKRGGKRSDTAARAFDTKHTDPFARQAETFLKSVLKGSACGLGTKEDLDVTTVLEAATRSMRTGGGLCRVATTPPLICKSAWARVDTVGLPSARPAPAVKSDAAEDAPSVDITADPSDTIPVG